MQYTYRNDYDPNQHTLITGEYEKSVCRNRTVHGNLPEQMAGYEGRVQEVP
jgi:hypothetical protein